MSRYISVDDMRGIFCQSKSLTQAWNGFDMAPTIDIVRCKDCKHLSIEPAMHCTEHFRMVDADFFCGDGERREP